MAVGFERLLPTISDCFSHGRERATHPGGDADRRSAHVPMPSRHAAPAAERR